MKRFSPDGINIWTYKVDTQKIIGCVPYKYQCQKDYFHGEDLLLEKRLSLLENNWSVVFEKVVNEERLTIDDLNTIKEFAVYQRQRTATELEYEQDTFAESIFVAIKMKLLHQKKTFDVDKLKKECIEYSRNRISPSNCIKVCDLLIELIDDLKVLVINYNTDRTLLLSDTPIIMLNPFFSPGIGYGVIGLIIFFPISPHCLIVVYDSKIYSRYREQLYIESKEEEEVIKLNALQLVASNKLLYGSTEKDFNYFTDEDWNQRHIFRDQKVINELGSDDQKLIMTHPRLASTNADWSFAQIQHRYRRIPFICKDAYPRFYDEGWNKKLDERSMVLSKIFSVNSKYLNEEAIDLKTFKRGCERIANEIRSYWRKG